MKRWFAVFLTVAFFVTVLAAPNYDSVIRVGSDQNPTTMDPAMYQDLASAQVMRNVFETLVAYDADVKKSIRSWQNLGKSVQI